MGYNLTYLKTEYIGVITHLLTIYLLPGTLEIVPYFSSQGYFYGAPPTTWRMGPLQGATSKRFISIDQPDREQTTMGPLTSYKSWDDPPSRLDSWLIPPKK